MPLSSQRPTDQVRDDLPGTFRVLTVCTGNLCRSPTLEQLLRCRLPEAFGDARFEVSSAGTHAIPGQRMDPGAVREALRLGVSDADGHRAHRLTEGLVRRADLVLGLAREHRSAAVQLEPGANGRAFTLLEFTHLVEHLAAGHLAPTTRRVGDLADHLRHTVRTAQQVRGQVMSGSRVDLDVVDPHRREPEIYRASADVIDGAVTGLLSAWTRVVGADQ